MLLVDLLKGKEVILASASPRRRELMAGAGIPFRLADPYEVEETFPAGMDPHAVPQFLAELKSNAYPHPLDPQQILITADTIVLLDGRVIGKPADRDDALAMLGSLSGRTHEVITAVTLRSAARTESFSAHSHVRFRTLSAEEITHYVDTFQPYDKAGSYGIQEWIGYIGIEAIDGSFYNVMGLPIQLLYRRLSDFATR